MSSVLLTGGNLISFYTGWILQHKDSLQNYRRIGGSGRLIGVLVLWMLGYPRKRLIELLFCSLSEAFNEQIFIQTLTAELSAKNLLDMTLDELHRKSQILLDCFYYVEKERQVKVFSVENDPTISVLSAIKGSVSNCIDVHHPVPIEYFDYEIVLGAIPYGKAARNLMITGLNRAKSQGFNVQAIDIVDISSMDLSIRELNTARNSRKESMENFVHIVFKLALMFHAGQLNFSEFKIPEIKIERRSNQPYCFVYQTVSKDQNPFSSVI